jgi:hypothetical protein
MRPDQGGEISNVTLERYWHDDNDDFPAAKSFTGVNEAPVAGDPVTAGQIGNGHLLTSVTLSPQTWDENKTNGTKINKVAIFIRSCVFPAAGIPSL